MQTEKTNLSPCSLQYPYEGVTSHTQPTHKRCENIFFKSLINNNKHSPKFLFDTISKLLNSPQSAITPMPSNEFEFFFLDFFTGKINSIRSQLKSVPLPSVSNRYFRIHINQCMSSSALPVFGVPQRSILQSILFSLYMLSLGKLINVFNRISYDRYADDTQLYFSVKPNNQSSLLCLGNVSLIGFILISSISISVKLGFQCSTQTVSLRN